MIVSLGTNDCKLNFHLSPELVAKGAECLCRMIKEYDYRGGKAPKILLVSPILIGEDLENCPFESFDQISVELASQLAPCFRAVAERQGCLYLDAASVASPGSDQLHMDAASHRALAENCVRWCGRNLSEGKPLTFPPPAAIISRNSRSIYMLSGDEGKK